MTTNNPIASFVSRIKSLSDEKKGLQADIAEVFKEAKEAGLSPKIIRLVLKRSEMTEQDIREEARLIEEYEAAVGDLATTPLGQASRP